MIGTIDWHLPKHPTSGNPLPDDQPFPRGMDPRQSPESRPVRVPCGTDVGAVTRRWVVCNRALARMIRAGYALKDDEGFVPT